MSADTLKLSMQHSTNELQGIHPEVDHAANTDELDALKLLAHMHMDTV